MTDTRSASRQPLLKVEDLRVEFRTRHGIVRAVNGVEIEVGLGEAVGIVGESGSGKSVTVMTAAALGAREAVIRSGSVIFDGHNMLTASDAVLRSLHGSEISVIFQNPETSFNPVFQMGNQLTELYRFHPESGPPSAWRALGGEVAAATGADRKRSKWRELASALLRSVNLPDAAGAAVRYPHQLSGGMRQRAMISASVALAPRLIIADEPTTALDVTIQAQILRLLRDLQKRTGTALIMISHDLSVIAQLCDVVYVMYAGKVVERATTVGLFENPRHPYTRALLMAIPRFEGALTPLVGIPGSPPDLTVEQVGCPFASRCPRALPICTEEFPAATVDSPDHSFWCFNP